MKLDPGMHIGMHLVFFGKAGVTWCPEKFLFGGFYKHKIVLFGGFYEQGEGLVGIFQNLINI
jgi:hypothetical protein